MQLIGSSASKWTLSGPSDNQLALIFNESKYKEFASAFGSLGLYDSLMLLAESLLEY